MGIMSRRNHTALAYNPQADKLHPSVSPALARAFDGFFGPPARELSPSMATPPPSRRNHTALAPTPCPGVSPEMKRAFDGFFGPPAREQVAVAPVAASDRDRRSVETLPPYEPPEVRSPLPVYSVVGRY